MWAFFLTPLDYLPIQGIMKEKEFNVVDFISNITVLIIVVIFWHSFFQAFFDKKKHINSLAEYLLLVEHESENTKHVSESTKAKPIQKSKVKKIKKPKKTYAPADTGVSEEERKNEEINKLKEDCNLAMQAIHVKAKERKFLIQTVFEKHNPKTVEEFLRKAFA